MSQLVYIETSVVSYCTARPSTHIITAAKQAITRTWWEQESPRFSLYISAVVEREASRGDPGATQERMERIRDLPLLAITHEAEALALHLIKQQLLPAHSVSVHGLKQRDKKGLPTAPAPTPSRGHSGLSLGHLR